MKEVWKPIKEFEGFYEISSLGNVRSLDRKAKHSFGRKMCRNIKGQNVKLIHRGNWYVKVHLRKRGKRYCFFVHRLVALAFLSNPDNKPEVNHKNGIKTDNSLINLEWNTISQNKLHAIRTGLRVITRGEQRTTAILNDEKVRSIRELYATGDYFYRELGDMYGVNGKTVESVVKFRKWKHVV